MRDEFGFDDIASVEFCVSVSDREGTNTFIVPSQRNVQEALREMLTQTVHELETVDAAVRQYELSEEYPGKQSLRADLASDEMATIRALYEEEGWVPNPAALREPADISHYSAVFRDGAQRKLVGVRRAAQFKGVVKSRGRLITLVDDTVTVVADQVFKLDKEFDFIVTRGHVYILNPTGFAGVADIEDLALAQARRKAMALGRRISFVDFSELSNFVAGHKRAARLVAALSARDDLNRVERAKVERAAAETEVRLEPAGRKLRPAAGSEIGFLELLDDRRYADSIRSGPKEAYVANSRRRVRNR